MNGKVNFTGSDFSDGSIVIGIVLILEVTVFSGNMLFFLSGLGYLDFTDSISAVVPKIFLTSFELITFWAITDVTYIVTTVNSLENRVLCFRSICKVLEEDLTRTKKLVNFANSCNVNVLLNDVEHYSVSYLSGK